MNRLKRIIGPNAAVFLSTLKRSSSTKSISNSTLELSRRRIIESVIRTHTKISQVHMSPELKLHLLTSECPLYHCQYDQENRVKFFEDPYWAIYWPGGQVLARFLLDHGQEIFKKLRSQRPNTEKARKLRVLDVGAGCGAAAIAAKIAGADEVVANDIDEVACIAALMNAELNDVQIAVTDIDLISTPITDDPEDPHDTHFDVILIGDLLYDENVAARLVSWLARQVSKTNDKQSKAKGYSSPVIYLGDPGRHGLTEALRKRLKLAREYALPESVRRENYGFDRASVWQFREGGWT